MSFPLTCITYVTFIQLQSNSYSKWTNNCILSVIMSETCARKRRLTKCFYLYKLGAIPGKSENIPAFVRVHHFIASQRVSFTFFNNFSTPCL